MKIMTEKKCVMETFVGWTSSKQKPAKPFVEKKYFGSCLFWEIKPWKFIYVTSLVDQYYELIPL